MDDKKGVKKPLLLSLSAMKKKLLPPSFLADVRVLSLLAALLFACYYAGLAAYNLRDRDGGPASCEQQAPSRVMRCYELEGEDVVAAAGSLDRGLLWCSPPQAAAAATALLLLSRRGHGLRLRALAMVALAAAAANHWMYFKILGILRASSSTGSNFSLAVETVAILLAAELDLLGFVAFLPGGDE
ncbi:unnamed protein product [Urochloa decumbens]|uniref:Uncharacterized protein n=1 Tax=Urochloa decumbens TaxID=240449 RepID=A0ABC8VB06_9POAL